MDTDTVVFVRKLWRDETVREAIITQANLTTQQTA